MAQLQKNVKQKSNQFYTYLSFLQLHQNKGKSTLDCLDWNEIAIQAPK